MASAQEEQAFLDGTHPALHGAGEVRVRRNGDAPLSDDESDPGTSGSPPTTSSPDFSPQMMSKAKGGSNGSSPRVPRAGKATPATQTGPKGVLADYRSSGDAANRAASAEPTVLDDFDELELEDDGEQAALEAYRRQRLAELSGSGQRRDMGNSTKVFGHLRALNVDTFLPAIDEEDPSVSILIHVYEPEIEACEALNRHLSHIARTYPHTKFLRVLASEVEFAMNMEEDTLPTLLLYKAGNLVDSFIAMDRNWGSGSRADITQFLVRKGALPAGVKPLGNSAAVNRAQATSGSDSDE